jgi:hypothetical protein
VLISLYSFFLENGSEKPTYQAVYEINSCWSGLGGEGRWSGGAVQLVSV